jgi:hypothetical protein
MRHSLRTARRAVLLSLYVAILAAPSLDAQAARFDRGRMWTFERPPVAWFDESYGVAADSTWLARARLGALRIPGCSASFVSPEGLVLTNHHCVRDRITQVEREGEDLHAEGFAAGSREEERPIEGFVAEQLLHTVDVTERIEDRVGGRSGPQRVERVVEERGEIREELREEWGDEVSIEFVELFSGARTSAYVWREFTDVRLVWAPEEAIGFFGGEVDNFEYPRYNLDAALLRIWAGDAPLDSGPWFFELAEGGASEGDAVFVVGNPGSTSRYQTLEQLATRRDVVEPATLDFVTDRATILEEYSEAFPAEARAAGIDDDIFSARNSVKAIEGQLAGFSDEDVRARLEARERALVELVAVDSLETAALEVAMARAAAAQERKRALAREYRAFLGLTAAGYASPTLHRGFLGFQILNLRSQGAPVDYTADIMAELDSVESVPEVLDELLIQARLDDYVEAFGTDERWLLTALRGRTTEGAAARIHATSIFTDSAGLSQGMQVGQVDANDPVLRLMNLFLPTFRAYQEGWGRALDEEDEAVAEIARLLLEFSPEDLAPDATGSLRIADGRIEGYTAADGSTPEPFTTFEGLFARADSLGGGVEGDAEAGAGTGASAGTGSGTDSPWALPERWWAARDEIAGEMPLNFVASADIAGGNSGSPVLNAELELVGLAFDSSAESLPGDYIFIPELHRMIAVDARALMHALERVYGMYELVRELRGGAVMLR